MNILIVCHYFYPEIGAPQARLSEMASSWIAAGHKVTVITCFPNHPTGIIPPEYLDAYRYKHCMSEIINGVRVERCWVYATPNKGFLKKILGHLSFMVSAVVQGRKYVRGNNIIVVSSPTFFSVISAWFLSKINAIPYIFEVRDLWPAIFVELGILKNHFIITTLERIELFLYTQAKAIIPVTDAFKNNIIQRGISADKITVITNGVDLNRFYPVEKNCQLVNKYALENKFVVLYCGAHGISHALTRIIDAAQLLQDYKDIHFVFVGEGAEKDKIVLHASQNNTVNVTFISGQSKEMVPGFYSIMDVGLVPLRNIPLFETFIPSKMFEIMAMGKPIVASVKGESAEILHKSNAALICDPEDSKGIANNILVLYNNRELYKTLSENGRKFVVEHYNREALSLKYLSLMKKICTQ